MLDLGYTRVHDVGALGRQLTALKDLCLQKSKVSDAGLSAIAQLPALVSLSLDRTVVGDAGLASVAQLPNLSFLYMNRCQRFTGAGVTHLQRAPKLRALHLQRCEQVEQKAIHRLCAEFPMLHTILM